MHSFPKLHHHYFVKYFSDDLQGWEKEVSKSPDKLKIEDISGYITAVYEGNWWLGYLLQKNEELDEVKITFLHPFGSSASFSYPRNTDVLWVSIVDVLTKANPVTPTGRSYVLLESDVCKTNVAFSNFK
ncbi:hypothetical protein AVEN_138860-1 [Araneus ventricosus]|uniref:Uncharacterized protein n=1 Tax=Araneus ventricosus TaxID=182803 RepID=A0A4Y2U3F9_ARAVE|nr:hypothetical protein AVEN_138860-1 [Araneus ventricosus]